MLLFQWMAATRSYQRGFTLIASAVSAVALFGMAGMAIDLSRMYIAKNEAQTYADSAALYAAMELDGKADSLMRADAAVTANPNKWNFGTSAFSGTVTEYSADGSTGWATSVNAAPAKMSYVRVTATINDVALFFLPVTGTGMSGTVKASANAGMALRGTSDANPFRNTVFPYSPIANVDTTVPVTPAAGADPFGWVVGGLYDLKWPRSGGGLPCSGDNNAAMIRRSQGGREWGEIVLTGDAGGHSIVLGQPLSAKDREKNYEAAAFEARAAQDTNHSETCLETESAAACAQHLTNYLNSPHNGRRLVTVIVNNGSANAAGTSYVSSRQNIAIGFAQFWLLTSYPKGGSAGKAWCAVYAGPASQGAASVRLIQ
jgi:Flp pilus assembly protein TadG